MKVYLDNNHSTMMDPQVLEAMEPCYSELYACPSVAHNHAKEIRKPYAEAMEKIYAGIHAKKSNLVAITSGADESNERLFMSVYLHMILTGQKNHIVISERESDTIVKIANFMATQGCHVSVLPINSDGIVEASSLQSVLTSRTALVSVTMVDSQTGAIMPIDEMSEICAEAKVLFHSDATYAIGKIPIDVQMLGLDFLTYSAEVSHGPTGIGALYIKENTQLQGLDRQSQHMAGIIGMGKAIELCVDAQAFEMEDVREMRDELEEAIREIPDTLIITTWTYRVAHTVLVAFKDIESEMLLWGLNKSDISAYAEDDRLIIDSIGADSTLKHSLVGFALSRFTIQEEIDYTIEKLKQIVRDIRAQSDNTQEKI